MKILVFGSKGMLGQELVKNFSASYEVIAFDKTDLDISDFFAVKEKINEIKPEIVINSVAINSVDKIEEDRDFYNLAKKINGESVGNLAKICQEKNILLVHYSSDHVFGGDKKDGYAENAIVTPINKYGESKALGEELLIKNTDQYYLIRLSKLFGLPAITPGAKKSFVDTMIWLATTGNKTHLDLVNEEISSPTYAPDLADFTRQIIENNLEYGIYHGANSGSCTWYEFAKQIFILKNLDVELVPVKSDKFSRSAKRPLFSTLLNTKLEEQRNWKEALKEYLLTNSV